MWKGGKGGEIFDLTGQKKKKRTPSKRHVKMSVGSLTLSWSNFAKSGCHCYDEHDTNVCWRMTRALERNRSNRVSGCNR